MDDSLVTVDQIAQIMDLHPRTIRRFIREGRLKAKKLGKQWRILRRDLDALLGKDTDDQGHGSRKVERIQVSAVVDIRVDDEEEAARICNSMLAATVGKGTEYGPVQYQSIYLQEERKARLMFWGDAAFIGNALITVHKMSPAGVRGGHE